MLTVYAPVHCMQKGGRKQERKANDKMKDQGWEEEEAKERERE